MVSPNLCWIQGERSLPIGLLVLTSRCCKQSYQSRIAIIKQKEPNYFKKMRIIDKKPFSPLLQIKIKLCLFIFRKGGMIGGIAGAVALIVIVVCAICCCCKCCNSKSKSTKNNKKTSKNIIFKA